MKIEGEYTFDGPREEVWKIVRDPDELMKALPGTQSFKQLSPTEYEGSISIRIGPVSGSFAGKITVSDEQPPEHCTLTVEGKGAAGFAKGVGNVFLSEQGPNKTLFKYIGELNIGGKLAGIGQRLIDSVGKSMIGKGLDTLNKNLVEKIAAKAA